MTGLEAYARLLTAGIDAPNPAPVARLVAAAAVMRAGFARQPQDQPAAAFPVPCLAPGA